MNVLAIALCRLASASYRSASARKCPRRRVWSAGSPRAMSCLTSRPVRTADWVPCAVAGEANAPAANSPMATARNNVERMSKSSCRQSPPGLLPCHSGRRKKDASQGGAEWVHWRPVLAPDTRLQHVLPHPKPSHCLKTRSSSAHLRADVRGGRIRRSSDFARGARGLRVCQPFEPVAPSLLRSSRKQRDGRRPVSPASAPSHSRPASRRAVASSTAVCRSAPCRVSGTVTHNGSEAAACASRQTRIARTRRRFEKEGEEELRRSGCGGGRKTGVRHP